MATALSVINDSLEALADRLELSTDIQGVVKEIVNHSVKCINDYHRVIEKYGTAVLAEKELLANAASADEVNVEKMEKSLHRITVELRDIRRDLHSIETDVNSNIESVRARKREYDIEIDEKEKQLKDLEKEIDRLRSNIEQCETECENCRTAARELDDHASRMERRESDHIVGGLLGAFATVAGVVMVPFTSGLSLALAGVGVVGTAVNVNSVLDCRAEAESLRWRAREKSKEADSLRERRDSLQKRKSSLPEEIRSIREKIEKLEEEVSALKRINEALHEYLSAIDKIYPVFQSMDTTFAVAMDDTHAFTIIKNAFARQPEKMSGRAQVYMDQLREKWDAVEAVLTQRGGHVSSISWD